MERRARFKLRGLPVGEDRDRIAIAARRLAAELREHRGPAIELRAPGNWFGWLVLELADGEIGFQIGRSLSIG
jgi:hypothetical protein